MFGNKKKLSQEELQRLQELLEEGRVFLEELKKHQELFEGDNEAIAESKAHLQADVEQAIANSRDVLELARQNSSEAAELSYRMEEEAADAQKTYEEYKKLGEMITKHLDGCRRAVEQNKHFTTPSKMLGELSGELRAQNNAYLGELDDMGDLGRQMSVLSLNAAIEAGRLGDSAQGFVNAAEEVRSLARQYERSVASLREKIISFNKRTDKIEDKVHQIIALLKDNNVAITKLMRDCEHMKKTAERAVCDDFSGEFRAVRQSLIGIKNTQDEIIKAEERNQIQYEDILSETDSQKRNEQEIADAWGKLCRSADIYREKL